MKATNARRHLAKPTLAMLPRIGDSLSFLYLESSPRERRYPATGPLGHRRGTVLSARAEVPRSPGR